MAAAGGDPLLFGLARGGKELAFASERSRTIVIVGGVNQQHGAGGDARDGGERAGGFQARADQRVHEGGLVGQHRHGERSNRDGGHARELWLFVGPGAIGDHGGDGGLTGGGQQRGAGAERDAKRAEAPTREVVAALKVAYGADDIVGLTRAQGDGPALALAAAATVIEEHVVASGEEEVRPGSIPTREPLKPWTRMMVGALGEASANQPDRRTPSVAAKVIARTGMPAWSALGARRKGDVAMSETARTVGASAQSRTTNARAAASAARGVGRSGNRCRVGLPAAAVTGCTC